MSSKFAYLDETLCVTLEIEGQWQFPARHDAMALPPQSDSDERLVDQVSEAWRSSSEPPNIAPLLEQCVSRDGQLRVVLEDIRHRREAEVTTNIDAYLRSAPLVADDRTTRLKLLENVYALLVDQGSKEQAEQFIVAYPELCVTQLHPTPRNDEFDTIVANQVDQPTPLANDRNSEAPSPKVSPNAASSGPHHPLPQESFGRYQIVRKLGQGGFGAVYLAHDSQLDREVAIKSLHKGKFTSGHQAQEFLREARSTARLNHPSIVTLYDVAESSDNSLFAVMEYVDGDSLAQRIEADTIDLGAGIEILVQVAQALGYAHRRGFVHRDLKPGNILIDQEGRARVADFGLAIHEDMQRMRAGELAGTPAYMAPEQVRGETHRLDGRTDIWSLGVILYQLLTRRLPFSGNSVKELFVEIQHRKPRPPRQIDGDILPALDRICRICLSPEIEHRYGTADDLAIDLDKCLSIVTAPTEVSIASNPALVFGGLTMIIVGFGMSFVGGFFVWVTYLALAFAFGVLNSTAEYTFGLLTFGVLSSPFFLGLPIMILGLWVAVVQGLRWRGRKQYTSGKAMAALALGSLTPLINIVAAVPALFLAREAFREIRRTPRVKGRVLAWISVLLTLSGTVLSTWMIGDAAYVYTAFQATDRARVALNAGRYDDVIFETRVATTRYPSLANAWKMRGEALLQVGKPRGATEAMTHAITFYVACVNNQNLEQARVNTSTHNIVFNLSECYRIRGEANAALGRDSMAAEDHQQSEKYRVYTKGRMIPLSQLMP